MNPEPVDAAGMLRHFATEIDDAGQPIAAGIVIILNGTGAWSAMTTKGMSPLVGVALLEFAKTDLVEGGNRWTEFTPKAEKAANDN